MSMDWGTIVNWRSAVNGDGRLHPPRQVDENNGLPVGIYVPRPGTNQFEVVSFQNPMPVLPMGPAQFKDRVPLQADIAWQITLSGYVFVASDGDQNDRVTGQTSFANTTPTFLWDNPITTTALVIPFYYQLVQTGTVAGGDISVETEIVHPSAYASNGTSEKVGRMRPGMSGGPRPNFRLFSGATATAGYGQAIGHLTAAADVSGAEGIINIYEWQAPTGTILDPNTSINVFTSAGTTGPTWGWHFVGAEFPLAWL